MKRWALVVTISILFSVLMVGFPVGAAEQAVGAAGFSYVPPFVAASRGDTVRLQNLDVTFIPGHTFTTDAAICRGFDANGNVINVPCNTGIVGPQGSATVTLSSSVSGAFVFYCQLHTPVMQGIIVIR